MSPEAFGNVIDKRFASKWTLWILIFLSIVQSHPHVPIGRVVVLLPPQHEVVGVGLAASLGLTRPHHLLTAGSQTESVARPDQPRGSRPGVLENEEGSVDNRTATIVCRCQGLSVDALGVDLMLGLVLLIGFAF